MLVLIALRTIELERMYLRVVPIIVGWPGPALASFMSCLANQLRLDRHSVCLGFCLDADVSVRALHRNLTDGSSGFYMPPVQADRRFIALRSRCLRMVKSASVASRSRS